MSKEYAILPCNGLDKCAGCTARELAIKLAEETESEIICPVFYRVADARYNKLANEKPLLVIDGCASRCASRLAAEKGLKIAKKINISEEAKNAGIVLKTDSLRLGETEKLLVENLADALVTEADAAEQTQEADFFPKQLSYDVYQKDKFIFRIPKEAAFFFNENDVWVYVSGGKARIGVTDYVQQSLSDIMFFTAPNVGTELSQFDEVGSLESGKAVFEIVSPVSGTITKVNEDLLNEPERINQNPYEQGWIAEIELEDFEEDKELLYDFNGYFPIMKRKVDEFHV